RAFLLVLCTAALLCAAPAASPFAQSTTIYRDTYGVPHIYARTDAGTVYGLMYAQAEDNFWQLETDYIRALGRMAEVEGPGGIANDILSRAYEVEQRSREHYEHAPAHLRALCDAFAAGVNRYLATHPEIHPRLLTHFEPWFILAEEHRGPAGTG